MYAQYGSNIAPLGSPLSAWTDVSRGNVGQLPPQQVSVRIDEGRLGTHAYVQTELLREQNRLLDRLTRSAQHPGSKFAKTEASAAFGGVAAI